MDIVRLFLWVLEKYLFNFLDAFVRLSKCKIRLVLVKQNFKTLSTSIFFNTLLASTNLVVIFILGASKRFSM